MTSRALLFTCACVFLSFRLIRSDSAPVKIDLGDIAQVQPSQMSSVKNATSEKVHNEDKYDVKIVNQDSKTNVSDQIDATENPINNIDFSKPGVLKRAVIVFGGFTLLGVAYFTCYRWRHKKTIEDTNNPEGNQFRYGVLHSDDRSDRMELSHMPLTMESDDDDEDDLEIFDLGQKKSYMHVSTEEQKEVIDDIVSGSRKPEPLIDIGEKNFDSKFDI